MENLKKITSSKKPIVFMKGTAGYFIHEVLGYLVESDYITNNFSIIGSNYNINDKIAVDSLNVVDDPAECKELINLGSIDDEGEAMTRINIIEVGYLTGLLCNTEDSIKLNRDDLKGCARRQSYQFKCIPRMRNTFIKPSLNGMNELEIINNVNDGFGISQIYSGYVSPLTGIFSLQGEGYLIKKGILQSKVKNITIEGNIIEALKSINIIGKEFFSYPVYCVKFNQSIPVCVGAPTVLIEKLKFSGDVYEGII